MPIKKKILEIKDKAIQWIKKRACQVINACLAAAFIILAILLLSFSLSIGFILSLVAIYAIFVGLLVYFILNL